MRREGYEFALSRPQVITKEVDGKILEPWEALVVDIEEAHVGPVMEMLQLRRADMTDMANPGTGRVRIEFKIPTRGLFGLRTEFLTETRGTGLLYHTFLEYGPWKGDVAERSRGALIAKEPGETTAYAIAPLQERSILFLPPGVKVYNGQVVGENSRDADMVVQIAREKAPHEHARLRIGDRHPPGHSARDDPRTMPRVDRSRRARGGHAEVDPDPEEDPRPRAAEDRLQEGRRDRGVRQGPRRSYA